MDVLMVGVALDTNGQKHRFVEAARRWGEDETVTRALIAGDWDGAGIPARLAAASSKGGKLAIRSAHRATAYFDFPLDIRWDRTSHAEVQTLADEADVIHLTNEPRAYFQLHQARLRKPAVLHHHGTLFRSQHERLLADGRRLHMVQAVSTLDLKRYAPDELHWLPAPIDVDAMRAIREANRRPDDGRVRIVTCPTNFDLKSTRLLEEAVAQLGRDGLLVDLVVVTGRTWAEALAVKATADIYFDQIAAPAIGYPGGYGCNAIEAWAMGLPVVAGADEWTTAAMRQEIGTDILPYAEASADTLVDVLRRLVGSATRRKTYAQLGERHVEKFHAEKPALRRLAKLYGMAIREQARHAAEPPPPEVALGPGVFRTTRPRLTVRVANQTYTFREDEPVTIESPQLGQKMRALAQSSRTLGIYEVA